MRRGAIGQSALRPPVFGVRRRTALAAPWLLAGLLAGCTTSPKPQTLHSLTPPPGGRLWALDLTRSQLRIVAFRAGAMARVGHHHILQAGQAQGWLWLPAQGLDGAQGELKVPLAGLDIDDASWREEAGGEFNEKPVSREDIAGTRRNLLASLRAQDHPEVVLQLLR
jgi:hypothetical protein